MVRRLAASAVLLAWVGSPVPAAAQPPPQPPEAAPPEDAAPEDAAPPATPAESAPPDEEEDDDDKPLEVRVRGQQAPRASETVIRRDVLRAAPHATGSELLKTVPGVAITQHSGQGKAHQIFFRGFDAEHGQDVEVSVGGVPINEVSNLHGQGYADLHFVMPEIVKTLRSTPGTYDPRQGEFAIAGSLSFDLGYDEPGATVAGTLGSFGERRLFAAFHPEDAPEETFAAVEIQGTDGFGPSRAADRASAVGQALLALGPRTSVRVLATAYASHFDSAGVLPIAEARRRGEDRFATLSPKQGGDSSRLSALFAFEGEGAALPPTEDELKKGVAFGDGPPRDRWQVAPFFVHRTLRLRHDFTGYLVDPVGGDGTEQINDSVTIGQNASYDKRLRVFDPRDGVAVGVYARGDLIEQSQKRLGRVDDRPTATLVAADLTVVDVAAWFEATAHPLPWLKIRAGLRADGIHGEATDQASPTTGTDGGGDAGAEGARRGSFGAHLGKKASLEVVPLPGLRPYVSYGEGFRGRQVRSLSNGEDAPFVEVQSGEVGVRWGLDRLSATISGFHTYLDGDLVFDPVLARNEPAGPTRRNGIAGELTLRPAPWMVHASSVTFVHAAFAEDRDDHQEGDLVPYAPQLVARSDLGIAPTVARFWERDLVLRAGLGLSYLGVRALPFSELGSDSFVADASLGARLGEVELRVDATNVLDASYFDGEFVYASQFDQGAAPSLVPQRHVTVGAPLGVFATLALYL